MKLTVLLFTLCIQIPLCGFEIGGPMVPDVNQNRYNSETGQVETETQSLGNTTVEDTEERPESPSDFGVVPISNEDKARIATIPSTQKSSQLPRGRSVPQLAQTKQ